MPISQPCGSRGHVYGFYETSCVLLLWRRAYITKTELKNQRSKEGGGGLPPSSAAAAAAEQES